MTCSWWPDCSGALGVRDASRGPALSALALLRHPPQCALCVPLSGACGRRKDRWEFFHNKYIAQLTVTKPEGRETLRRLSDR